MPPTPSRVEERVSTEVTAGAVLGRGVAGGTAVALLYDGVGAVSGRADYGLAVNLSFLTAASNTRVTSQSEISVRLLPAYFTFLVCRLPSVPILIEGTLVCTLLSHVLHKLLVSDLLAQVTEVARDDLQVVPGVPGQADLRG